MRRRRSGGRDGPPSASTKQWLVSVSANGRGAAAAVGVTAWRIACSAACGRLSMLVIDGDASARRAATKAGCSVAKVGHEAARVAPPVIDPRRSDAGGASCRRGCVTATRALTLGQAAYGWATSALHLLDDGGGDGGNLFFIHPAPPASAGGHALGRVVALEKAVGGRNPGQGAGRPPSAPLAAVPGRLSVAPRGG